MYITCDENLSRLPYQTSISLSAAASSFSVKLDCPRFLNVNTSRSFFETASVLAKVIAQSNPETFREIIFQRDVDYVRNSWEVKDVSELGFLSRNDVVQVLDSVTEMHWKDEIAGLSRDEKHHLLVTFCDLAHQEEDGTISFESLISALRLYNSRCYYSGSKEIQMYNRYAFYNSSSIVPIDPFAIYPYLPSNISF